MKKELIEKIVNKAEEYYIKDELINNKFKAFIEELAPEQYTPFIEESNLTIFLKTLELLWWEYSDIADYLFYYYYESSKNWLVIIEEKEYKLNSKSALINFLIEILNENK